MREVLLDTDILSYYFRGELHVVAKFEEYLEHFGTINFSNITYYELVSGLKFKNAVKQLQLLEAFAKECTILPLTLKSIDISADLYAKLRKAGTSVDDIDLLIAGIALSNNMALATNNSKHFSKIQELEIVNWSK